MRRSGPFVLCIGCVVHKGLIRTLCIIILLYRLERKDIGSVCKILGETDKEESHFRTNFSKIFSLSLFFRNIISDTPTHSLLCVLQIH